MSYDDGSLGERGAGRQPRRGPLAGLRSAVRAVYDRLRTHVREWPRRYVDQQAALYESGDRE